MSDKVYCKDCKWYDGGGSCFTQERDAIGDYKKRGICYVINANNDCKDYKRKWWKIWVKAGDKV